MIRKGRIEIPGTFFSIECQMEDYVLFVYTTAWLQRNAQTTKIRFVKPNYLTFRVSNIMISMEKMFISVIVDKWDD